MEVKKNLIKIKVLQLKVGIITTTQLQKINKTL